MYYVLNKNNLNQCLNKYIVKSCILYIKTVLYFCFITALVKIILYFNVIKIVNKYLFELHKNYYRTHFAYYTSAVIFGFLY